MKPEMKPGIKLFSPTKLAVEAMASCCGDGDKSPVAPSEVYNETWMLRMTLSFIHDFGDRDRINDRYNIRKKLLDVASAVRRSWISEGGLSPVFDMEGPTWTDAILGNIKLDKQGKTKRGVVIDSANDKDDGVVVIEAKVSSALASGITHASDYNQVVRNVACLAQLVMGKNFAADSAFFVFAPQNMINDWQDDRKKDSLGPEYLLGALEDCKSRIWNVIENQCDRNKNVGQSKGSDPKRKLKYIDRDKFENAFKDAVKKIVTNSKVISWESIIQSFDCDERESLKVFYVKTCEEYGLGPCWG
jgi:hypothetical protein